MSRQLKIKVTIVKTDFYPYVVFLPSEEKNKTLGAIFGSRAAVDILTFSLSHGISERIYQKDIIGSLPYSNKTIIKNLKLLTKLGILTEDMEKKEQVRRIVWVKAYELSDIGKWFALLLAEEKDLSESEKGKILQNIFRLYIKWVKGLSEELQVSKEKLEKIFLEEMGKTLDSRS